MKVFFSPAKCISNLFSDSWPSASLPSTSKQTVFLDSHTQLMRHCSNCQARKVCTKRVF